MSIKEQLLKILINQENNYISGENLASSLNVSRNSIWKAIKSLENDGYEINAIRNKGYCILSSNDILSREGVFKYLKQKDFFDIEVFKEVSSTNTLLKENLNAPEGKVLVSSHQTKGRGRLLRNFHSPKDTGVYFSFILRPNITISQSTYLTAMTSIALTAMTSIAVSRAIFNVTQKNPQVKWVNDIFLDDKKVCGILCEASFSMENASLEYVILGIGINVYRPNEGFPKEIEDIAGYILEEHIDDVRNKLVANILDNFYNLYQEFDTKKIVEEYKSKSYILGKEIYVIKSNENIKAFALDIDDNCGLVVKYEDGTIETLNSGEISTKIIK